MARRDGGPWWTIRESQILAMLYRVRDGEDPDEVYAEVYANSEHHEPSDDR